MSFRKLAIFAATAVAISLSAHAASADVTVGAAGANSPNGAPFGNMGTAELSQTVTYQQVFAASAFGTGAQSFSSISLFNSFYNANSILDSATYSVSFYYTSKNVGALSTTNLASNLGTLIGNFGTFSLSGAAPDVLTLTGNSFTYDPSQGNLLMQVLLTSVTENIYDYSQRTYFVTDSTGQTSFVEKGTTFYYASAAAAPVTTFGVTAVPGPVAGAGLPVLLGLIGFVARRRRQAA